MADLVTSFLIVTAVALAASAIGFLAFGLYTNVFQRFLSEVHEESAGGVSGAGSVAIRKLGAGNRQSTTSIRRTSCGSQDNPDAGLQISLRCFLRVRVDEP